MRAAGSYRAGAGSKDGLVLRSIGFFFLTSGFFARRLAALIRARDPVRRDMVSPLGSGPKDAPYGRPLPEHAGGAVGGRPRSASDEREHRWEEREGERLPDRR